MTNYGDLGAKIGGLLGNQNLGTIGSIADDILGGKYKNPKSKVIQVQPTGFSSGETGSTNTVLMIGLVLAGGVGVYLLAKGKR